MSGSRINYGRISMRGSLWLPQRHIRRVLPFSTPQGRTSVIDVWTLPSFIVELSLHFGLRMDTAIRLYEEPSSEMPFGPDEAKDLGV